ncbi:MAG: hypothetical protein IJ308_00865 [Clostridia bacterium]|nr:hypothetical protein [Clostridia bacterium]
MDLFYEESAKAKNEAKKEKKYAVLNILSNVFMVIGILISIFFVLFIPDVGFMIFFGTGALTSWGMWFILFKWKNSTNVSYDYAIVTDEIRISKVVNTNKRKLVARIATEAIIQVGDVDSTSYDRFKADPNVKSVICTSNEEAAEDKFFMYILADYNGRKLFVLECREEFLINLMHVTKRTALDRDYVAQEKKKQQQV